MTDPDQRPSVRSAADLGRALAEVGRTVRAVVGAGPEGHDHQVVRTEGGDEVFGVDARADEALLAALQHRCGTRWPGTAVMEGYDDPQPVGDASGPWRYLVDPVDGSRPWLAGKRSAWVLLGAGWRARTLADLDVSAVVELPTARAAVGLVAWATAQGQAEAVDDDLTSGTSRPATLQPVTEGSLARRFVTVQRFAPGSKAALGAWEDQVLGGLETYEDPYLSSGGQMLEVAWGREAAVLDPRPLVAPGTLAAHPYDLAGWLVAAAAGVIVEALPPGPLDVPLDTTTPVAWAAYGNEAIAARLRPRAAAAGPPPT